MIDRPHQRQQALLSRLKMRHLALLVAVARQRTLSRVAAELQLTQPAITKALREIEDVFMSRLFDRSPRGLAPTAAGRAVLAHAQAALADMEAVGRELAAIEGGLHGSLRLGVIPHAPRMLLDAALAHVLAQTPRVAVVVREGTTDELVAALRGHELDVAIGRAFDAAGQTDIAQEPLYRQSPCLLVHTRSRARLARGPLDWERLAALDWILPPMNTPIRRTVNAVFAGAGVAPPVPWVETYSLKSIDAVMRRQPNAIAILAHDIGAELAAGGAGALLPHPLRWSLPPVSLLVRKERAQQRETKALAAAVRAAAKRAVAETAS